MADEENDGSGGGDNDVRYFDSDFSFEEHEAECSPHLQISSAADYFTQHDDDDYLLRPQSQSKQWDAFHSNHSAGNFYKPRRYLTKSFPCILQYVEKGNTTFTSTCRCDESTELLQKKDDDRILLEIGCGSGSSCIPIIKQCSPDMLSSRDDIKCVLLACDSSPVAVETTRRSIKKMMEESDDAKKMTSNLSFGAFVADPSLSEEECEASFLQQVNAAYNDLGYYKEDCKEGIVGIVLMVFVLSAVTPSRVARFLEQVYQTTKPGGIVCFRDYGVYDLPMLRFAPSAACKSDASDDPVFLRGERTIARFFSIESAKELFESAGFATVELRYCTVYNHNRKTGQKLKRVFVHGVFEKPR